LLITANSVLSMSDPYNFIISGDIHLKIKSDIPEQWQIDRYRELWNAYEQLCHYYDASLILSGDIFHDHKISSKEMMLFIELITHLTCVGIDIYIIDGNHDYSDPNNTTLEHFRPLFDTISANTDKSVGTVTYRSEWYEELAPNTVFNFLGHSALKKDKPLLHARKTNILISHFRPTINEFIKEEIDVKDFTNGFDYCFVSDIHTDLAIDGRIIYTNAPCNSSFESSPKCGCLLVTVDSGKVDWKRVPLTLPNLVQITCTPAEFELGLNLDPKHFYRVTVNGSAEELRSIKTDSTNVKLLKVPEDVETYTDVDDCSEVRDEAIEEALVEYMKELQFSESKIQDMMEVFYGTTSH
jgi:DNA repair exonuclease SbcCD nuclease subunit